MYSFGPWGAGAVQSAGMSILPLFFETGMILKRTSQSNMGLR